MMVLRQRVRALVGDEVVEGLLVGRAFDADTGEAAAYLELPDGRILAVPNEGLEDLPEAV